MADYKKIIILEGFDMVGKSTFADKFLKEGRDHKMPTYYPGHTVTDLTVGRNNAWVVGYSILEFLSQVNVDIPHIVINRGVFSSYVYSILYGHAEDKLSDVVIDWYKNNQFFKDNVDILFFQHYDKSSARIIYENSMSRKKSDNEITAELDRFGSFDHYWRTYNKANELFIKSFNLIGITPYYMRTNEGYFLETKPTGSQDRIFDLTNTTIGHVGDW